MGKIKLFTDSTSDLSKELIEKYDIQIIPLYITMDEKSYKDRIDVTSEEIIKWCNDNKTTPKTSAVGIEDTVELLRPFVEEGDDIIYIGISEDMSTTCNVVRLAASELDYDRVFVINSMSLSTGIGLQVLRAADMIEEGRTAEEIYERINDTRTDIKASFVVDTLTFLARGGRCSSASALVANTLQIHPRIEVNMGKMGVGEKYRGKMGKVLLKYAQEMEADLLKADKKRVFITHSPISRELAQPIVDYVKSLNYFDEVIETDAGGVVTSHCGESTLGVLFYAK